MGPESISSTIGVGQQENSVLKGESGFNNDKKLKRNFDNMGAFAGCGWEVPEGTVEEFGR